MVMVVKSQGIMAWLWCWSGGWNHGRNTGGGPFAPNATADAFRRKRAISFQIRGLRAGLFEDSTILGERTALYRVVFLSVGRDQQQLQGRDAMGFDR